jgi:hypothetical protein
MTIENDLLRMLEPAVRPVGLPPTGLREQAPFESRSFESFLEEARTINAQEQQGVIEAGAGVDAAGSIRLPQAGSVEASRNDASKQPGWVRRLSGVDRIENGAMRELIGKSQSP